MPVLMGRRRESVVVSKFGAVVPLLPTGGAMEAWNGGRGANVMLAPDKLLRVLIIDDNHDAADSLSCLVKVWGHDPGVAYDGADALAQASAELPDVLLIDIGMPKMDGFQLACHLRQQIRYVNTLLVAVTGWADRPHRRLWTAAFDHYLIKPVDPSKLDKLLRDRNRLVRSRIGGAGTADDIRLGMSPPEGLRLAPGRATQLQSTSNQFLQESSTCYD